MAALAPALLIGPTPGQNQGEEAHDVVLFLRIQVPPHEDVVEGPEVGVEERGTGEEVRNDQLASVILVRPSQRVT